MAGSTKRQLPKEADATSLVEWLEGLGTRGLEGIHIAQSHIPQRVPLIFPSNAVTFGWHAPYIPSDMRGA
eukprot:5685575-Amphidinium_carterae.1